MRQSIGEKLVTELFADINTHNWDKLESMIHPAFQSVHEDGARNKDEEMRLLKGLHLGEYSLSDFNITMSESVMIVSYAVTAQELIDGKSTSPQPSYRLSVFHKMDEGWKWVAHASFITISK
ncbi:MAG: nuclear transport factor 2 family protein [Syntrophales bacterium]|nr:nuclear transport factor 2 family protein [Syntrophales bacterium]